jgi:serine phosphatase RsbU (regulator of sigma subunit)/anti-sigma regulatory factor (Ser/Thr protein kinase)
MVIDAEGRITHWSRGAELLFGRRAADVLDRPIFDVCIAEAQHGSVAELLSLNSSGSSWSGALPMVVGDNVVEVECAWQPLLGETVPASLVIVTDTRKPMPIGSAGAVVDAVRHFHEQAVSAAARNRLALLNDASVRIGTTLDIYQTARELIDVAVPRFCDSAVVMVHNSLVEEVETQPAAVTERMTDASIMRRLAVGASANHPRWAAAFPPGETVSYPADSPYAEVLRTGVSQVLTPANLKEAERLAGPWDRIRVTPLLARHSVLIVPLHARGSVLGFLVFNREPDRRPFAEHDVMLGEELAARAAVCIDNARLYSRERSTALTLQRSLLPEELAPHGGIEVTYRYLPGSDVSEVGGDWFDMIPLSGSRVAFVVGDVMGNGLHAAAIMGQLRTAVRTLASLDLPPTEVLRQLDESAQHLGGTYLATCIYAAYDPVSRICEIARAGHVPPMLVDPLGNCEILEIPPGLPLGIGGAPFESVEFTIADGSTLALCTDGLVESRERDIDTGLNIMREQLRGVPGDPDSDPIERSLEALANTLVQALFHKANRDDTALLLTRLRGLPIDAMAAWTLPAVNRSPSQARRLVREQLTEWGLDGAVEHAVLLTSELVTNAVRYGGGPVKLRLVHDEALLCEVTDGADPPPRPHAASLDDVDGRGLLLVNQLSSRWGTRRLPVGKTVWFELDLRGKVRPTSRNGSR